MSRKFNLHRFPLALAAVIAAVGAGAGAAHAQGVILPPVSGDTAEMTVKCEPLTIVQTTFISCKASLTSDTLRTPTGTVHWSAQRIVPGTFPPEPIAGPAGTFAPQSCGLGDDGFRRAGCSSTFTPDASAAGGTVRVTGLYMSTSDHDTTSAHYTLLVEAPANADSDGDGVVDSEDAFPHDINEQKDSDADGTGDNADVFPTDANETVDTDGDGVGDNGDNCSADANFDQADLDSDDAGDACDSDIDGDSVANSADAFPMNASESLDSDGDGVGDNADRFPNDAGESSDTDDDGTGDGADNCEDVANADQADLDGDGEGDACDADVDGDGVSNATDNAPVDPNADQQDLDEDGIGDVIDSSVLPLTTEACKKNGWTKFHNGSTRFKNQGDCVSYAATTRV